MNVTSPHQILNVLAASIMTRITSTKTVMNKDLDHIQFMLCEIMELLNRQKIVPDINVVMALKDLQREVDKMIDEG